MPDISKFSFAEALSNSDGKTSGSKFAGLIGIIIGSIGFLAGVIGAFYRLPDSVAIAGLSSALITGSYVLFGYSKSLGPDLNAKEQVEETCKDRQ